MVKRLLVLLLVVTGSAAAGDGIPLPFTGLYLSPGGTAREKSGADRWREIAQDVGMRIVKDAEIIELQLRITVTASPDPDRGTPYAIANTMWLVKRPHPSAPAGSGRVDFDVYKTDRATGRFDDVGDGYCRGTECRYEYVTHKPGHQQRYRSHLTWKPQHAGSEFRQIGDLSVKSAADTGWVVYKTWDNQFRRKTRER